MSPHLCHPSIFAKPSGHPTLLVWLFSWSIWRTLLLDVIAPFIFHCNNTVVIQIREKWQERKVYRIHPPMKGASVKMLGSFLHSNVFQKNKLSDLALDWWLLTRWKVWTASSQISVNGQWWSSLYTLNNSFQSVCLVRHRLLS